MAEAITHPFGFVMLVAGLAFLMWVYGQCIAPTRRRSLRERVDDLERALRERTPDDG
ncbi:MAG: hypothetical protein OXU75_11180 [Deltaproteobacteria bacterium]|nr:hypothetical protein [Deltaproteobacteria bacterium]